MGADLGRGVDADVHFEIDLQEQANLRPGPLGLGVGEAV